MDIGESSIGIAFQYAPDDACSRLVLSVSLSLREQPMHLLRLTRFQHCGIPLDSTCTISTRLEFVERLDLLASPWKHAQNIESHLIVLLAFSPVAFK